MKLPKTFIPEKDLDEVTDSLLSGDSMSKFYSDRIMLDGLSFQQLEVLTDLEDKIDHLRVSFNYQEYDYELIYTPNPAGRGLLQLMQFPPRLSQMMIERLGEKIDREMDTYKVYDNPNYKNVTYVSWKECFLIDFPLRKKSISLKSLEKFFSNEQVFSPITQYSPDKFMFNDIRIYVEYCNLKKSDMQYVNLIPRKHRLDKSKTYET